MSSEQAKAPPQPTAPLITPQAGVSVPPSPREPPPALVAGHGAGEGIRSGPPTWLVGHRAKVGSGLPPVPSPVPEPEGGPTGQPNIPGLPHSPAWWSRCIPLTCGRSSCPWGTLGPAQNEKAQMHLGARASGVGKEAGARLTVPSLGGNRLREGFHVEKALCPCMSYLVWGRLEGAQFTSSWPPGDRCYRKAPGILKTEVLEHLSLGGQGWGDPGASEELTALSGLRVRGWGRPPPPQPPPAE